MRRLGGREFRIYRQREKALKYSGSGKNSAKGQFRQSQLNIVAGTARGVKLVMPDGDGVRPTIGRAREALFSSLGNISGVVFWDLFAGSGANGCEAASRGAATAVLVEKDRKHILSIEENIRRVTAAGCQGRILLYQESADAVGNRNLPEPDIIFADPPYGESSVWFGRIVPELVKKFPEACIVWEVPDFPGASGGFIDAGAAEYGFQLKIFGGTKFFVKK